MWPFKRKKKSIQLYKCTYHIGAKIIGDEVSFNLKDKIELIVRANDIIDAQVQLAKKVMLTPHGYIHKIEKMIEIEV